MVGEIVIKFAFRAEFEQAFRGQSALDALTTSKHRHIKYSYYFFSTHFSGGFGINTPGEVAKAASDGIQVAFLYNYIDISLYGSLKYVAHIYDHRIPRVVSQECDP